MTPVMRSLVAAVGALWIAVIMWDAFEAIVLPRRVTRRLRPARMFYRMTWRVWSAVPRRMRPGGRRETFLSFYGPDRKSTRLNSSHVKISYAVFCLKKK